MKINELVRENIRNMQPYSCARSEFKGEASVYLDANENPYNSPFNRYPDPLQTELKKEISKIKKVPVENIFLGNGSDEAIDLLYRAFCEPKIHNVVAIEPSYGMYKVCAEINNVEYRPVLLDENFDVEAYKLMDASNDKTKIIWLCSPNNPTGNSLNFSEINKLLSWFRGIVVIDEAYIDFSTKKSLLNYLTLFPQLIVLQTMSKAWGNAGIRLGMAFADPEIIGILNKIKYPYNINYLTQQHALQALQNPEQVEKWVALILEEKEKLIKELQKLKLVEKIYPSDANFILVKVENANAIYRFLIQNGIVVRNRSNMPLCNNCIRITVGTPEENKALIDTLKKFHV
ncbi:MAG: histidinol-phosphate transaminase [Paludibacteraceae bacterium]|nr:histidinol-phosphate transaminase [Paludibacteraceae bacterium]OPZ02821.1 MAG: Histidinol-phosphate aminotransferase [Bacteroidetes bacterium ADurb.BinA395]